MLWLSPDVQYARSMKEDDQKDDQGDDSQSDSQSELQSDSDNDWPSLAALSLHDGANESLPKETDWYKSLEKAGPSVLIYTPSSRSWTDLCYSE